MTEDGAAGFFRFFAAVSEAAGGSSEVAIAWATLSRTSAMSGSAVSIIGGTRDSVEIFWLLAFIASCMNVPSAEEGRSVETSSAEAFAMPSKLVTTACGLSWVTMAAITHFWRAIRL